MLILFLMWKTGAGFSETHEKVKRIRGVCNPNTGFMVQLLEWHKRIHSPLTGPRLYRIRPHCKEDPNLVVMKYHPNITASVLDPRLCFILHTPEKIFVWEGSELDPRLNRHADYCVERLHKYETATSVVEKMKQGEETEEFWGYFDGASDADTGRVVKFQQEYDEEVELIQLMNREK